MVKSECTRGVETSPIIRIRGLSLGYGETMVLRDVNLDIPQGVFLPFVGPNGAGKTTLLRAILGLLRPMEGEISITPKNVRPAYVAQQKAIDPIYPVSVRDIVAMGLYPYRRRMKRREQRDLVDGVLRELGLSEHTDKTFDQLSGGQRQKVLIARALVAQPRLIIMDEPTTELDEPSQQYVLAALHRAVIEEGCTVLIAHHGLDAISAFTDRVCLVRDMRVRWVSLEEARF